MVKLHMDKSIGWASEPGGRAYAIVALSDNTKHFQHAVPLFPWKIHHLRVMFIGESGRIWGFLKKIQVFSHESIDISTL